MFWIVTLRGLVSIYQHFWGTLTFIFRAEDGGSTSSKMLVSTHKSTRHYNSEDQPNMLITMRTWNLIRKFDYCYVYISVFKVCMSQCMFTVISLAIFYSHFLLNRCNRPAVDCIRETRDSQTMLVKHFPESNYFDYWNEDMRIITLQEIMS